MIVEDLGAESGDSNVKKRREGIERYSVYKNIQFYLIY